MDARAVLLRHSRTYPLASRLLGALQRSGGVDLAPLLARAERHGALFWETVEGVARDLLELYPRYAGAAFGKGDFAALLAHFSQINAALPHEERFEDFDEVAERFYDQPIYPVVEHVMYAGFHGIDRLARVLELAARAPAAPAGLLCDLGVGPAVIAGALLARRPGWRGIALDVSARCARYARDVLALHGVPPARAAVGRADARSLPLADARIDLAVATEILEHVPDPAALLGEIRRVLRPGGRLVASVPVNLPWGPHLVVFRDESEVRRLFEGARLLCEAFTSEPHGRDASITFGLFAKA